MDKYLRLPNGYTNTFRRTTHVHSGKTIMTEDENPVQITPEIEIETARSSHLLS